jgi:hypothetical protein
LPASITERAVVVSIVAAGGRVLSPDPVALMLVEATFAGGRGVYPNPTAQALVV